MVSSSKPIHRNVASTASSADADDSKHNSSLPGLPMYTTDLESSRHPSRSADSGLDEKSASSSRYSGANSADYGFDYGSNSGASAGSSSSSKLHSASFLSLTSLLNYNSSTNSFGSGKYKNNRQHKIVRNILFGLVGFMLILLVGSPVFSFIFGSSSGYSPVLGSTDKTLLTSDPFIYPDIEGLFKPKGLSGSSSSSGGSNRQAPKKSPGDYTHDLSDKEMPAAAKGSKGSGSGSSSSSSSSGSDSSGSGSSGSAGSSSGSKDSAAGDADTEAAASLDLEEDDDEPKTNNNDFKNRNSVISSLRYKPASNGRALWRFSKQDKSTIGASEAAGAAATKSSFWRTSPKSPEVILVTGINPEKFSAEYLEKLIENRKRYAEKWGYGIYVRLSTDFRDKYETTMTKSPSWAKLSILRAGIHAFPEAKHFWNLDAHVLIEDMSTDIVSDLIEPKRLSSLMYRDRQVVRSSSIIKTYKHTSPENVRLILSPDQIGVSASSFILANLDLDRTIDFAGAGYNRNNVQKYKGSDRGQFAKVLLDYWNDPATRAYYQNDRSESSALNHMLQWHASFLSRTAIVPGSALMSYSEETVASLMGIRGGNLRANAAKIPKEDGRLSLEDYENDQLVFSNNGEKSSRVVVMNSCEYTSSLTCLREFSKYYHKTDKQAGGADISPPVAAKDPIKEASKEKTGKGTQEKQKAQQQQQAHEAQAHAQAQAEAHAEAQAKEQAKTQQTGVPEDKTSDSKPLGTEKDKAKTPGKETEKSQVKDKIPAAAAGEQAKEKGGNAAGASVKTTGQEEQLAKGAAAKEPVAAGAAAGDAAKPKDAAGDAAKPKDAAAPAAANKDTTKPGQPAAAAAAPAPAANAADKKQAKPVAAGDAKAAKAANAAAPAAATSAAVLADGEVPLVEQPVDAASTADPAVAEAMEKAAQEEAKGKIDAKGKGKGANKA